MRRTSTRCRRTTVRRPPREATAALRDADRGESQAAHLRSRQAIRRQGSLLSRSHRHRRGPSQQGTPRDHPGRLRQAIPRMERQGRRPRVGVAAARDDADAGQASRRQDADAGAARPHRGHPGGLRRPRRPARRCSRCWKPTCRPRCATRSSTISSCSCPASGPACAGARTWPRRFSDLLESRRRASTGLDLIARRRGSRRLSRVAKIAGDAKEAPAVR